jgi:predicted nucleotidyltransferase/uncharacterized protein (UPF0332 family)
MVKKVVESKGVKRVTKKLKEMSPTLAIAGERDIASDFATKVYEKFDHMIKSIVLFGSSARAASTPDSDIDVIVIIDDVSVNWDAELIAWYREELGKVIQANPYAKALHVNTVKLSTWWDDMMRGDPVVINVLRYGDALIDHGGFFNPLRVLLKEGKIKATPESIYTLLQRAPNHMMRARQSMLAVVDGLYWTMVDAAHAALISANVQPASPEEIPEVLNEHFVKTKRLNKKYVGYYFEVHKLAKEIVHGKVTEVKGKDLDEMYWETDAFLSEMAKLVDESIDSNSKS